MVRDVLADPVPQPAGNAGDPAERADGELRLDPAGRCVRADGQPVKLTATETAVLAALLGQQGRVLSRRQLLAAAGRPATGDRAVDVIIAQLRAKIGEAGTIRTVRGAGYAFDRGQFGTPARFQGGSHRALQGGRATISGATVPI